MTFGNSRMVPYLVATGCVLGLAACLVLKKRYEENENVRLEKTPMRSEAGDRIPCNIFELEAWKPRLGTLTEMSLAKCDLRELPAAIGQCKNLIKLDLAYNNLESLPAELAQLKKLEILFILGARKMKRLPAVLGRMHSLTRLGMRSNGLEVLTGDLPPNLEHLILTDNHLIRIEESAYLKFGRLRKLMLANNKLTEFTGGKSPQRNLRNLELLRLANNKIKHLPPAVLTLPKLSWLALAGNPILSGHEKMVKRPLVERIPWSDIDFGDKDERLGSGASGTVLRATWRGRHVAVKKLQDRGSDGRASDEVDTIDTLFGRFFSTDTTHTMHTVPNSVVATRGVVLPAPDSSTQKTGLIMDLLPSGVRDLAKPPTIVEVTRDRYPPAERFAPRLVAKILSELCAALVFLHDNFIMHGDVYAHNTLVHDASDTVKLGDLGAAFSYDAFQPNEKRVLFQQLEVRAFGILVSELNARLAYRSKLQKPLTAIAAECLNSNVSKRPTFSHLLPRLQDIYHLAVQDEH